MFVQITGAMPLQWWRISISYHPQVLQHQHFLLFPTSWVVFCTSCSYSCILQVRFKWIQEKWISGNPSMRKRRLALFKMQMNWEWLSQKQNCGWWNCINFHACILEQKKIAGKCHQAESYKTEVPDIKWVNVWSDISEHVTLNFHLVELYFTSDSFFESV